MKLSTNKKMVTACSELCISAAGSCNPNQPRPSTVTCHPANLRDGVVVWPLDQHRAAVGVPHILRCKGTEGGEGQDMISTEPGSNAGKQVRHGGRI